MDGADRMGAVDEARHDTEVPAAPAQRPEQVGVAGLAGGDEAAVSQHDVGLDEVETSGPRGGGRHTVTDSDLRPAAVTTVHRAKVRGHGGGALASWKPAA